MEGNVSKEDQKEISALTLNLRFTCAQFIASHAHSERVHSAATGPLRTTMNTAEREG